MPTSEAIVLPTTVRPVKYRIKLQPDLERFTFQGDETIDINVVEATREIVLIWDSLRGAPPLWMAQFHGSGLL